MTFTLKTEFADLPEALQYMTTEVQAELTRLTTAADAFEAEKRRILANRDELLNEAKQAKERARQAEDAAKQIEAELALVKSQASGETSNDLEAKFAQVRSKLELDFAKKMAQEAADAAEIAAMGAREAKRLVYSADTVTNRDVLEATRRQAMQVDMVGSSILVVGGERVKFSHYLIFFLGHNEAEN